MESLFSFNPAEGQLRYAAQTGDLNSLMGFIRVGVDLNATDESGRTALHFAAAYGRLEAVQTLLTAGASINVLDSRGNTPLHVASISGHTKVVEYLVSFAAQDKNGSIVFAKDAYGKTPLQWAMDRLQRIKMSATSSSTSLAEVQMQLQQIVNIISNFIQQQHGQADSMRDAGSGGENSTYQVQLEAITNKVASMTTVDDIDEIGMLLGNLSL